MVHLFGRTIRSYVLAIVLLGTFVPLAVVGAWLTRGGVRSGEALLDQQLTASLDNVMRDMMRRWELRRGDLLMLAESPMARLAVSGSMSRNDSAFLSQAITAVDRSILSFVYVDAAGRERWSSARAAPRVDATIGSGDLSGGPQLDVEFPVHDARGTTLGALRARLRLNGILWTDSAKLTVPGSVLAVREAMTGRVLVPLSDSVAFPHAGRQRVQNDSWLAVTRRLNDPPIEIALAAASAPYVAPFAHAARAGLVALVVVGLLALSITVFMTTRLARSVDQLASAADAVSRGELDSELNASGPAGTAAAGRRVQCHDGEPAPGPGGAVAAPRAGGGRRVCRVALARGPEHVDTSRGGPRARSGARRRRRAHACPGDASVVPGAQARARGDGRARHRAERPRRRKRRRSRRSVACGGRRNARGVSGQRRPGGAGGLRAPASGAGDADALRHLFVNLLLNASQALSAGGLARVEARRDEDNIIVSVVDDGTGMSDESLLRAGQPFFTTRAGGTGLGLPIARQIAAAHGGAIQIARANGRGTVVRVNLPLAAELAARLIDSLRAAEVGVLVERTGQIRRESFDSTRVVGYATTVLRPRRGARRID